MKLSRVLFVILTLFISVSLLAQDNNPNVGNWETKTNMPTSRRYLGSAVIDGKIYVIGGYGGSYRTENECYDPATDSWTTMTPMPTGRNGAAVVALDGKIYVIGGNDGSVLDVNEVYDPVTNSWETQTSLPTPRKTVGGAALNGEVYVIGGETTTFSNAVEAYNPQTDSWTTKGNLNTSRYAIGAASIGGKIYAVGGYASAGYSKRIEEYNPSTDSWSYKTDLATGRSAAAVVAFSGRLYVIGGSLSGTEQTKAVDEYLITSDSWTNIDSMPAARTQLTAEVVGGKVYIIGGSRSGTGGAWLDENVEFSPPMFSDYSATEDAKIIVTAYMTGVAFSMSATDWAVGPCRPNENKFSPSYTLQNDGGVNIDLGFMVFPDSYGGAYPWTAWNNPAPFIDTVYMAVVLTDYSVAAIDPSAFSDPTDAIYESATYVEATDTRFNPSDGSTPYAGANSNGLNLAAFKPDDPNGDRVKLWLKFVATASARDPGFAGVPHSLEVSIAAMLSAPGGW